ncbi:hypothetical protein [Chryseobacterium sp. JK1]|uniref:hypothetical protein n=1 Tax=Chryseobacterium sp. JK1 TaxID=874294 RepID=UPI003D68F17E
MLSCEQKEVLAKDISIKTLTRNLSTIKGTDIYTSFMMIEDDTSDTLRFKLTDKDWAILNESFDRNQIHLINNKTKIGEEVNSATMSQHIKIRTNKRLISVEYDYYFAREKALFDTIKTIKFKKFMRTVDSLVYFRSKETNSSNFK